MLAAPPKMLLIEGPKNESEQEAQREEEELVEVTSEGRTPNNPFEILLGEEQFQIWKQ